MGALESADAGPGAVVVVVGAADDTTGCCTFGWGCAAARSGKGATAFVGVAGIVAELLVCAERVVPGVLENASGSV